ncbi:MAG: hypothetical protein C0404_13565 [Verrucomicrobia bacterium]|nr:hypothetical protein [Verrucomicrobiota bacterium]
MTTNNNANGNNTTNNSTNNTANGNTNGPVKRFGQKLSIYHPSSAGTGAALRLEPRVNRADSDNYNCFFLELAVQKTGASRDGDKRIPATFDWEKKLTVKLDFSDICELLAVLEGKVEKVGGQKGGLYHQNGAGSTVISLQKSEKGGYYIGLSKKSGDAAAVRVGVLLSEAEAIGLRSVFQAGLFFVTFHTQVFQATA